MNSGGIDRIGKIELFQRSLELLFASPGENAKLELPDDDFLRLLYGLFESLESAVGKGEEERSKVRYAFSRPADFANAVVRKFESNSPVEELELRLFDRLVAFHVLPEELCDFEHWNEDVRYLLRNAWNLFYALGHFRELAGKRCEREMLPKALRLFDEFRSFASDGDRGDAPLQRLAKAIGERDAFRYFRSFRYSGRKFLPVKPDSIKPLDRFYGFLGVRTILRDHFSKFSCKTGGNLPLLINSLPGYGKTSMVMSHVLANENLTLVLADPCELERGWNALMSQLSARPDRKFVLFFDDIDPDKVDWYSFRTNVGGAFSPPDNVLVVLAANYEFPTNVLSRGRKVSFPTFDEVRCQEMVEDFLAAFGMRRPGANLVSLIAADYTEEFGQKKFTELSPRSLTRYLAVYESDRIKRKTMVELSCGQMITKPDAQLFYEFNIDLMRSLYGDGYIERLLKDKLKSLEEA